MRKFTFPKRFQSPRVKIDFKAVRPTNGLGYDVRQGRQPGRLLLPPLPSFPSWLYSTGSRFELRPNRPLCLTHSLHVKDRQCRSRSWGLCLNKVSLADILKLKKGFKDWDFFGPILQGASGLVCRGIIRKLIPTPPDE